MSELDLNTIEVETLCTDMLTLGAFGGYKGGTDNMKGEEIRKLLEPFFGTEMIEQCVSKITYKKKEKEK